MIVGRQFERIKSYHQAALSGEKKKGEKKRENGGIGRPDERRQFTQRVTNIQIGRHAIKYRGIRIDEVSAHGIPRPGVLDRRP